MRILHLGDAASPHFRLVLQSLAERGIEQHIFTTSSAPAAWADQLGIRVLRPGATRLPGKLKPLGSLRSVRSAANDVGADIVHAHYATSYGMLGVATRHHPLVISAWGSDINSFPLQSPLHRVALRLVLRRSDALWATSKDLANNAERVAGRSVVVTPFGVDATRFRPGSVDDEYFPRGTLVLGTIKTLQHTYGIDVLLEAFALVLRDSSVPLGLLIAGGGPDGPALERLADELGIRQHVHFTGQLAHEDVPRHHQMIDIFANLSRMESYGVSLLEAASTGVPSVATDVGGISEVVAADRTGILVPADDPRAAAAALLRLIENPELRSEMGNAARQHVIDVFDLERTSEVMHRHYQLLLE